MNRRIEKAFPEDLAVFKEKLLYYVKDKELFVFLDSNATQGALCYDTFDWILGIGAVCSAENSFEAFSALKHNADWLFGYIAYDAKNELEQLTSKNRKLIDVPDLFMFCPKIIIFKKRNEHFIQIISVPEINIESFLFDVNKQRVETVAMPFVAFKPLMTKDYYINCVDKIKKDIEEGEYYEINLCQPFMAKEVKCDSYSLFLNLSKQSKAPYTSWLKVKQTEVFCASPERFLKKYGNEVISQPIKGTIGRGDSIVEDITNKEKLLQSEKERAENVMIVDLVRNDLSKVCKPSTVKVPELFGIYTFPTLHQMVSTVLGNTDANIDIVSIIKAAFPMGSMTGAPKIRVMQAIENYEIAARGIYSGAIGYCSPDNDFDFNVVIRTLIKNNLNNDLFYFTGGAITYDSQAVAEYEECILKGMGLEAIFR